MPTNTAEIQESAQTAADPVLSFKEVMRDLGVSKALFFRVIRHQLPVIQISESRFGVLSSDLRAFKLARRQLAA